MPDVEAAIPPAELAESLAGAVREAGALALAKFGVGVRNWTKGNNSPVCEADIEVDLFLRERLTALTPGYGWLSEESNDDPARLAAERVWVVDPIDGTRAFLAGFPDWSISAALVEEGRPIAAALYVPVADELFVAARGAGARLNEAPLRIGDLAGIDAARIAAPRSYLERLGTLKPGIEKLPKVHSLALRLARVAAGTIDVAFASGNSRDWDLAAADLMVHEAGGLLTDFGGRAPRYNRPDPVHRPLVAAAPARHAAMIGLLRGAPFG